jgi:hypothetical protein
MTKTSLKDIPGLDAVDDLLVVPGQGQKFMQLF